MSTTGLAALAERPAVGERPAELLLEREEEAGRQGERGEPQRRDRLELVVAADGPRADLEEGVGRDAGDEQGRGDRDGALGERGAGGRRAGHEGARLSGSRRLGRHRRGRRGRAAVERDAADG